MKFSASIFESWMTGATVDTMLAEIRQAIPEDVLARRLPREARAHAPAASMNLRNSGIEAMVERIETCLSNRAVHALDWYGQTMVVARSGSGTALMDALRRKHADTLRRVYDDADSDDLPFRMACFGDYGGEGDICWEIGGGPVNVLCSFTCDSDWWRPATARAVALTAHVERRYGDHCSATIVYRVDSADVLRALWSRTSCNDAIAMQCAPASAPASAMIAAVDAWSDEAMLAFAGRHGWLYQQRYGGGSDEHYGRFAAARPELALRAYRYAEQRSLRDDGWWVAGMS